MHLDILINYLAIPTCVLSVLWFPAYYTYLPVKMLVQGNYQELESFLLMILQMVGLCIVLSVTVQNIALYIAARKKNPSKNVLHIITTLLFFPFYNMGVCVANVYGIFKRKLSWKEVKHDKIISIDKLNKK